MILLHCARVNKLLLVDLQIYSSLLDDLVIIYIDCADSWNGISFYRKCRGGRRTSVELQAGTSGIARS